VADGPRFIEEKAKCQKARSITDRIDWPCSVLRNYSDNNLGCKERVSSGLDWVFSHVDTAIILEDDCLPTLSFFPYCETLLDYYRDDSRIMQIGGNNFHFGRNTPPYSYYFSIYNHIWGWASWRRAWKHYDGGLRLWPMLKDGFWIQDIIGKEAAPYWISIFDKAYAGDIDSWDYPWTFSCWAQSGLTILPKVNLVSNIGFDERGTHTKSSDALVSKLPTDRMHFPLNHPPCIIRNYEADRFTYDNVFREKPSSLSLRLKRAIRKLLSKLISPVRRYLRFQR